MHNITCNDSSVFIYIILKYFLVNIVSFDKIKIIKNIDILEIFDLYLNMSLIESAADMSIDIL